MQPWSLWDRSEPTPPPTFGTTPLSDDTCNKAFAKVARGRLFAMLDTPTAILRQTLHSSAKSTSSRPKPGFDVPMGSCATISLRHLFASSMGSLEQFSSLHPSSSFLFTLTPCSVRIVGNQNWIRYAAQFRILMAPLSSNARVAARDCMGTGCVKATLIAKGLNRFFVYLPDPARNPVFVAWLHLHCK